MKAKRFFGYLAVLLLFFFGLYSYTAQATLKYKKETGKRCTFCHTSVPKAGDEDPRLNEDGKKFLENGYKLTDDQKAKPDGD